MSVQLSDDQEQFRDVVTRFFSTKSQPTEVRKLMDSDEGYDVAVWKQLSGELGLAGTHIPESYGGFGFGSIELGIVAEEMGRTLYCGPFFASAVMAGYALLEGGTEESKEEFLPGIASGSTIATLALDNLNDPAHVGESLKVKSKGSELLLSGVSPIVVDAHVASHIIAIARSDSGLMLLGVPSNDEGITIERLETIDATRKLSRVTFNASKVSKLGDFDSISLSKLWDELCVTLSREMIGGAQALLDSTIEYMKLRVQFGRPIGSFQALKHRCADLLMELELAKAVAIEASVGLSSGAGDPYMPSMAKAMASEAYMTLAKSAIQLRGGIGFTWENDTHLWFKRAKSSEVFLGTPQFHRERMMRIIEELGHV